MTHLWVMDNNCVKYYQIHGPDTDFFGMRALWPWPWRHDLVLRSWHILGSRKTIVWNIIQIQLCNFDYGPDTDLGYVCTVTLTLEIWPWVKVIVHPLVMENTCVKYYLNPTWHWDGTDFGYVCTVTVTLEIWLWIKVMTHPSDMDNNCVKYYPEGTSCNGVMASDTKWTDGRTDRQADGQTGWFPYYQTLFARGGGYNKYTCSSGGGGVLQK